MKYIEINNDLVAENGDIFKKSSVLNVLTKASKFNPTVEVLPIKAFDEQNLPYPCLSTFSINNEKLEKVGYKVLDRKTSDVFEKQALDFSGFNFPGAEIEDEDGVTAVLREMYADKDYEIDVNGTIKKKAEDITDVDTPPTEADNEVDQKAKPDYKSSQTYMKDQARKKKGETDQRISDQDKITQKPLSDKPDGKDDPGTTDNYKEDTKEKKAPNTIIGPIPAMKKKLQSIRKKLSGTEDQNLSDDDKITQDKKTDVPGSATVSNPYKSDEKEMKWKDKHLPNVPSKKKAIGNLEKKEEIDFGFNDSRIEQICNWHDDAKNYKRHPELFEKLYSILEKYNVNEEVTIDKQLEQLPEEKLDEIYNDWKMNIKQIF